MSGWSDLENAPPELRREWREGDRRYQQACGSSKRKTLPKWACVTLDLGNALSEPFLSDRPENLEAAIAWYKGALRVSRKLAIPTNGQPLRTTSDRPTPTGCGEIQRKTGLCLWWPW